MIESKRELRFYIMADMMMNRGKFKWTIKDRIRNLVVPDYIMQYLLSMRYCSYYLLVPNLSFSDQLVYLFHRFRFRRLGLKLGFTIGPNTLGYGLVIPHYGTIVIGGANKIGKYAVLHTSTCISNNENNIGDCLYLSTGAKITSKVVLGDNISVAANSVVTKSFESNKLLVGAPAISKSDSKPWYVRDGMKFLDRVKKIETLKSQL